MKVAQMNHTQASALNLPNALTVFRILGVPFFGWVLLSDAGSDPRMRVIATVVFIVLMITDRIDGDLARKHNLVTNFGKIADPIADKALTGMAFIGLSIIGVLWWWVTIVILLREWGITLLRFVVMKHGVMPASQGGRIKTTLQSMAITGYLLPFDLWDGAWAVSLQWVAHVLMAGALAVTLITAVWYVRDAIVLRRESKQ